MFVLFVVLVASSIIRMRDIGRRLELVEYGYLPMLALGTNIANLFHLQEDFDLQKIRDNRDNKLFLNTLRFSYPKLVNQNLNDMERLFTEAVVPLVLGKGRRSELPDGKTAELLVALRQVQNSQSRYQSVLDRALTALPANNGTARAKLSQQLISSREESRDAIQVLNSRLNSSIQMDITKIGLLERRGTWMTVGLSILGIILVFGIAIVALFILNPIRKLTHGAKVISQGDYSHRVDIRARDEVGILATEFNSMAQSIAQRNKELENLSHYNQNIIQSIRSGLLVTDANGSITTCNHALLEMLNLEVTDLLGKRIIKTELPEAERMAAKVSKVVSAGSMEEAYVVHTQTIRQEEAKKSVQAIYEVRHMPLSDTMRRAIGVITLLDDITEETLMKERLLRNEKLAVVGQLSAQVTHEIRNPLNSIGLNLEMLQEDIKAQLSQNTRELFDTIGREVKRLDRVAEHYLQFARPKRKQQKPVALNHLVEEVLFLLREEMQRRDVKVHEKLSREVKTVYADPDQLKQAILNLVKNASEALMERGGNIWISTLCRNRSVVLEVADDGPGIDAVNLAKIFDPFYSTKSGGTGLGLAVTQKIVQEQRGEIDCKLRDDGGTLFTLTFPVYEDAKPAEV